MDLGKLDHVNIRTANLDGLIAWYVDVLGMKNGDRPPFPFPGAWLYADGSAVVHLIGVDPEPAAGLDLKVEDLKLEHFALQASGMEEWRAHLTAAGVRIEEAVVPDFGITQFNIWDPDGNHIHIDFDTSAT